MTKHTSIVVTQTRTDTYTLDLDKVYPWQKIDTDGYFGNVDAVIEHLEKQGIKATKSISYGGDVDIEFDDIYVEGDEDD
jgi:hypothetical protein